MVKEMDRKDMKLDMTIIRDSLRPKTDIPSPKTRDDNFSYKGTDHLSGRMTLQD
jgi:hypothetical protein